MKNPIVSLESCKETMLLAKKVYQDQKFGDGPNSFGDYGKGNIRFIIKSVVHKGYIKAKQKNELSHIA